MSDAAGIIVLIGRLLFVIFPLWVSGYQFHIKNPKMAEGYAQAMAFPMPALAGIPTGVWLVVSSISIALGIFPDIGALMMAVFAAVAAWYFHRFWMMPEDQKQNQTMFFYRNVMIFAASLIMFGYFTGVGVRYSITGPLIDLR